MSSQSMPSSLRHETNRSSSSTSTEKINVDDATYESSRNLFADYRRGSNNGDPSINHMPPYSSTFDTKFVSTAELRSDEHPAAYMSHTGDERRRSVSKQRSKVGESKHMKNASSQDQCPGRCASMQTNRSRANSCSKPTPLGNDRRNSVSRRAKAERRASSSRRKDSVRPLKVDETKTQVLEDVQDLEQARRHRRIAMIVLGTFLFLLAASVLVVVVTLTHSTFLSPAAGSKELAEHRARRKFSS